MVPKRNTEENMHLITPKICCLDFPTWVVGIDCGGERVGCVDVQSSCGELSPAASTRFGILGASMVELPSPTWPLQMLIIPRIKSKLRIRVFKAPPGQALSPYPHTPCSCARPHWPLPCSHCAAGHPQWLLPPPTIPPPCF